MSDYLVGLAGCWLLADGLISIRLYLNTVDGSGKRIQSWRWDHSIRLIRCCLGIFLMVAGA